MSANGTGWSDLPVNIQEKILAQRLAFRRPLGWRSHYSIVIRAFLPVALVNSEWKSLATRVYYESNTFVVENDHSWPRPRPKEVVKGRPYLFPLPQPKPVVSCFIQKMELHFDEFNCWEGSYDLNALLSRGGHLLQLIIPNEPHTLFREEDVSWQRNYPIIKELTIAFKDLNGCERRPKKSVPESEREMTSGEPVSKEPEEDSNISRKPSFGRKCKTPLKLNWLDQVHIDLKAEKVEFHQDPRYYLCEACFDNVKFGLRMLIEA
jgi:hypothetical protein